jgi:FLVCR family MFS transporter 7
MAEKAEYSNERYLILALFSLVQLMNTAGWICFAAIVDKIKFAYPSTTALDVNYLSWIFMIVYLPMNPIATSLIENHGLRKSLLLGVSIETVGFWLRTFINKGFYFNMLGQTLIAIGQPFIYNQPVKLSKIWFPKEERIVSTMISINFSIVGNTVGFFLPLLFLRAS